MFGLILKSLKSRTGTGERWRRKDNYDVDELTPSFPLISRQKVGNTDSVYNVSLDLAAIFKRKKLLFVASKSLT